MKRLAVISVLLAILLLIGYQSMTRITHARNQLQGTVNIIFEKVENKDTDGIKAQVQQLCEYWDHEENQLIYFVRHSLVDDISKGIVRLPALAEHQDYAELCAELRSVMWQITHIWETEQISIKNVF